MCDCCARLEELAKSKPRTVCKITIWHGEDHEHEPQIFASFQRDSEDYHGKGKTIHEAITALEQRIAEG